VKQPTHIIDSHVHFWDRSKLEYRWLDEEKSHLAMDHLPVQLRAAGGDVDGLVFIQADCRDDQGFDEAGWVHDLAEQGVPVLAIVAHAPLETDAAARSLDRLTTLPLVRGIRRLLQDEEAGFAVEPRFVDGVRQLASYDFTFDLCVREHQLRECLELTARVPEVTFILDHLAKPNVSAGNNFGEWSVLIDELAVRPNVLCKLSGLGNEAQPQDRTLAAFRPWVEHAIAAFGADRCMYGSDWPVLTLATSYMDWLEVISTIASELTEHERHLIMAGTAIKTYGRNAAHHEPTR
jgi:L-fuconolactonase